MSKFILLPLPIFALLGLLVLIGCVSAPPTPAPATLWLKQEGIAVKGAAYARPGNTYSAANGPTDCYGCAYSGY